MRKVWLQIKTFFLNLWTGLKSIRDIRRHQIPHILENFSKKEIYTLLAALLIFILSGGFLIVGIIGSHGTGPHYGSSLTEGLVGQPQFINPILSANSSVDMDLSRIVYAQLLKFDDKENVVPDLAASLPTISKDQKTYTLKLKPNLKWQDGQSITANDVLFTIQTIQDGEFDSPLRTNWTRVQVTKIDDLTISFTLPEVSASFITNFAIGIIPEHIWANVSAQDFRLSAMNLNPVGSGPFVVSQIQKASDGTIRSITLRANELYYQGLPYLSQITFKFYDDYDSLVNAYLGKEIQSLGFMPFDQKAFLSTTNQTTQYRLNLPQYQAVFFNLPRNPILGDLAVRQALWLTTDRGSIISQAYMGNAVPAYGPILEGSLGYNPSVAQSIHYSQTEAGQILDKDGWILDPTTNIRMKKNKPLEFTLALSDDLEINVKTAQLLQSQWAQIGVKVDLNPVSASDLEQNFIRPRTFDAVLFNENVGADPDPFAFWDSSQSHDPGLNLSGFSNGQADQLLSAARQTSNTTTRSNDYMQFQTIINTQLPAIFLVRSLYIYNVPKNLQGINLNNIVYPSERFQDINGWYFQ